MGMELVYCVGRENDSGPTISISRGYLRRLGTGIGSEVAPIAFFAEVSAMTDS